MQWFHREEEEGPEGIYNQISKIILSLLRMLEMRLFSKIVVLGIKFNFR
jgi:N-glycosylase/DNA lyase